MLLILDNFEQILSAATLVTELLTISPGLRVLVTSRAPLKIYSEHQLVLEPLTYPARPIKTVNENDFSAVALFCERARQRHRGFELTDSNSSYIGQICQQLDGLPLAIELTAAYVSDLSLASIEEQLADRFALLQSDLQDTVSRHQTLEAAIQWSYTLLPEDVQAVFRQLSVFVGGWTAETAAVVLPNIDDDVLERCLEELVRHHLVTQTDDGLRYNMLLSISEFARSLFQQDDNSSVIYHHHAAFFLELAEAALENWSGSEQAYWLRRLRIEEMNLQAALQWSFDNHAYAIGVQLVHTLHIFWPAQGQIDIGLQWFEYARTYLEYLPEDDQVLFLTRMISLHYLKGDFKAVAKLLTLAEKVAPTANGDAELTGVVLANWGEFYSRQGDYAQAELYLKEAINMRLRASGSELSKGIAASMNNLGVVYKYMERYADAMAIYEQVLAYHEACNDQLEVAATLLNIGNIALVTFDMDKAISCYQAALDVFVELEHYGELSKIFWGFGGITKFTGSPTRCAQIYGFAEEFAIQMGAGIPDTTRESMEDDLEELRQQLGDDHLQTLLQKGAEMSLEGAIRLVKELQTPPV
ncbi:MAG: tetratricopeptide repeat protein [Chloroflexi bacterium]|nr:tetratricopeptide repeat protein [Chloroflexota bacterium]